MLAFHNDPQIKDKYLSRVMAHQKADEIIKGIYWEDGKGCAVGCTIHGSDHSKYEKELGIPIILARLEDGIFESLPDDDAKLWPEKFLTAINVGADLESVWPKFAVWLLTDEKYGVLQYAKDNESKKIIIKIADYYNRYKEITESEWRDISADANAAYRAAYAYAADATAYAAYAAAHAAHAAYAANAANAANVANAHAADGSNIRIAQSNKLLELLRECK